MIKELMHDPIFLAGKSEVATKEDLQIAQDLLDKQRKSQLKNLKRRFSKAENRRHFV